MGLEALLLMLAGVEAETVANPAEVRLICRDDQPVTLFASRRKMCLTAQEWEKRAQEGEAATHIMLRDYLGNTQCLGKGICTRFE
jgi:hypothetical protein